MNGTVEHMGPKPGYITEYHRSSRNNSIPSLSLRCPMYTQITDSSKKGTFRENVCRKALRNNTLAMLEGNTHQKDIVLDLLKTRIWIPCMKMQIGVRHSPQKTFPQDSSQDGVVENKILHTPLTRQQNRTYKRSFVSKAKNSSHDRNSNGCALRYSTSQRSLRINR